MSAKTKEEKVLPKRFIVTFREGSLKKGMASVNNFMGVKMSHMMSSADFDDNAINMAEVSRSGGVVFNHLGIGVFNADEDQARKLMAGMAENQNIIAIEPEETRYALGDDVPEEYLRGFRDASDALYEYSRKYGCEKQMSLLSESYKDTDALTWGLQATLAAKSKFSGKGIQLAVLDTGLDGKHPDFTGRNITGKNFIGGTTTQDGHGHGTHCVGTSCGSKISTEGPRYGVAYDAEIFVGKVLSDEGSGQDTGILAGIEWAVANKCPIISMSLGSESETTTTAYESVGQRALDAGSLIVAAAGNNANRSSSYYGFVGCPANSKSVLSVGALDSRLGMGDFSSRDTILAAGTAVDIAAPGVDIYSSWPMRDKYNTISGTSMAAPHVAGIAALWAESTGARGASLWQILIANAKTLSHPFADVGRGLVQAP